MYECYCTPLELEVSRKSQLAAGRPPRYAGTCRDLTPQQRTARRAAGLAPTLRFRGAGRASASSSSISCAARRVS